MTQAVTWLPKPQRHDYQAAGYHRVCASYWIDENTDIPCILV